MEDQDLHEQRRLFRWYMDSYKKGGLIEGAHEPVVLLAFVLLRYLLLRLVEPLPAKSLQRI